MKKILAFLLAVLMLVSFTGCKRGLDTEEVEKAGKIVIGIKELKPMSFEENGELTGFDIELARLFAKELGVEAEFVKIDWGDKFAPLNSAEIDCIWSGFTITTIAERSVSFSYPYLVNAQVLVMKADRVGDYENGYDTRNLKFVVEKGSAGEECVNREYYKNITAVDTQEMALSEVSSGKADAAVIDVTAAKAMIGEGNAYPDLARGFDYSNEYYGVAFRMDSDLIKVFNTFIDEIDEDVLFDLAKKYGLTLA